MDIVLAVIVTAAVLSMATAGAMMIYDTTPGYPGLSKGVVRAVTVLWLWPVTVAGLAGIGYVLGWLWGWAL